MDAILSYAANYGFPMAVTAFLLVRIETKLDALDVSIKELTKVITLKM